MAVHADGTGGNVRVPGLLNRVVAVSAIQPQLVRVDGMGERHRLDWPIADVGIFIREVIPDARRHRRSREQNADDDHQRQPICPLRKDVRHLKMV